VVNDLQLRQLVNRQSSGPSASDGHHLSLHRSLQFSVLHALSDNDDKGKRERVFTQSFEATRQQLPEASEIQVPQPEFRGKFQRYIPQLLSVHQHSLWPEPHITLSFEFAKVVANCGHFMWHNSQQDDAALALETAKNVLIELGYDKDHPLFGDIDAVLAIIFESIGVSKREEAEECRLNQRRIRKLEYEAIPADLRTRNDEIRLFNAETDWVVHLLQCERFEEVEPIAERCIQKYQSLGTEKEIPYEYAKYHLHISFVHRFRGQHDLAVEHAAKAYTLIAEHGGPSDPVTLSWYYSLANAYYFAGDIKTALRLNQRILENRKQVLGEQNAATLESYCMTGALLSEDNQPAEAKYHFPLSHALYSY
jgi:tetratricopeptide (TPR) repeat protein